MPRTKSPLKILHLDIETAPMVGYFWNMFPKYIPIGHVAKAGYTLCWTASWEGSNECFAGSVLRDGELGMLMRIHTLLDEADAVVHYNGAQFDIPILNREFIRHSIAPPGKYHQIDLIKPVRSQFRWDSNKLDWVCQQLGLGSKRKNDGMDLWTECMAGNEAAWTKMLAYNKQDVLLLKKLYKRMMPWITNHPTTGLWIDNPKRPTCSTCGSTNLQKKGRQHNTKAASYTRYRCNSCGTPLRMRLQSRRTSPNVLVRSD